MVGLRATLFLQRRCSSSPSHELRRTEIGIGQDALAYRAGLVRAFVSKVERGTTNPLMETMVSVASWLRCSLSDLWLGAERIQGSAEDDEER